MSPVVARMVAEHSLDIAKIPGTGRGGRVTKRDVEQYLEARARPRRPLRAGRSGPRPCAPRPPRARRPRPQPRRHRGRRPRRGSVSWGVEETSPLPMIRKVIARNMRASIETAAHVTSVSEVDMTRVVEHPQGAEPAVPARLRRQGQLHAVHHARGHRGDPAVAVGQRRGARRLGGRQEVRQPRRRGRDRRRQGPRRAGDPQRRGEEPARPDALADRSRGSRP